MRDVGRRGGAADRCHVGEELRHCGGAPDRGRRDRRRLQRLHRIDDVLRCLDGDQVLHAAFRVDPVVRRDLAARGERDQEVARHVALGDAELTRHGAVDVHLQRRHSRHLREPHVGGARNRGDLRAQAPGEIVRLLLLAGRARRPGDRWGLASRSSAPASRCRVGGRRRSSRDGYWSGPSGARARTSPSGRGLPSTRSEIWPSAEEIKAPSLSDKLIPL